jgi:hypothetical protein
MEVTKWLKPWIYLWFISRQWVHAIRIGTLPVTDPDHDYRHPCKPLVVAARCAWR